VFIAAKNLVISFLIAARAEAELEPPAPFIHSPRAWPARGSAVGRRSEVAVNNHRTLYLELIRVYY
jgi:hypothetical protein